MANKWNNFFRCFFILLIGLCTYPLSHEASESADFTINPIYGKGQTDDTLGYFSIKYGDEKSYPIKIKLKNLSSEKTSKFEVRVVSASTTDNGKINYTPSKQEKVVTDLPMIEDFVSEEQLTQVITLEPNEEKEVTVDLKKPTNQFDGTVVGSIYVKKKLDIDKAEDVGGIKNVFAMTIPIVISQDFDKKIIPKLELSTIDVVTEMENTKISGDISNLSPVMFGEIEIKSWITEKDKDRILYEETQTGYEMAPNSKFSYAIDIRNEILNPGEYTYHTVLTSGKQTYNLSKNFTIKAQGEFKKSVILQEEEPEKMNTWWIAFIMVMSILLIVIVVYAILIKREIIKPLFISKKGESRSKSTKKK